MVDSLLLAGAIASAICLHLVLTPNWRPDLAKTGTLSFLIFATTLTPSSNVAVGSRRPVGSGSSFRWAEAA